MATLECDKVIYRRSYFVFDPEDVRSNGGFIYRLINSTSATVPNVDGDPRDPTLHGHCCIGRELTYSTCSTVQSCKHCIIAIIIIVMAFIVYSLIEFMSRPQSAGPRYSGVVSSLY